MRKLVLISCLIIACKSRKAKILEQQEVLQHKIGLAEVKAHLFSKDADRMITERNIDSLAILSYQQKYLALTDSAKKYIDQKSHLLKTYDSLEMELRKH